MYGKKSAKKEKAETSPESRNRLCFFPSADSIEDPEQKRIDADANDGQKQVTDAVQKRRFRVSAEQLFETAMSRPQSTLRS